MSNFSSSSLGKLSWFCIKDHKKQIIGWCVAIFSIMFLYMILFPSVKEMAQIKMDAMPTELLQFVGMDDFSDMSNFITYFGMIFNILLIAICIFAASFGAGLISNEEKSKTIEFLYALEVSRLEIYLSKLATAVFAVFSVLFSGSVATVICGNINGGATFLVGDFIKIVKISGFSAFFFMALSLMIAGIWTKIGTAMAGSMAVLVCYVIGFLSRLLGEDYQWLGNLSPFELFSPENALKMEEHTIYGFFAYLVISVCFIAAGAMIYNNRDFNI